MFYSFELEKYLEELLPPREELLLEMEREALRETIPVVTPAVGHFLQLLLETAGARSILEIGTATGYSTVYLARGARRTGGKVLTIDMNKGRMAKAVEYIARAGLADLVEFRLGNALKLLPEISGKFDFIFVDAAKGEYRQYVEAILPLVADAGILVLDNVLFRGWVVPGAVYDAKYNKMVETLRAFLQYLAELPGYKLSVLPFGDGLAIARKI
ncbi:MAG: O-methyltransferase [Peptococcaceae bacterium]|nr:O-methyltransferase [Peptococcaceae bacterium]